MTKPKKPRKAKAPAKPKRPQGRQSTYTEALADHIIDLLSEGTPLREICRMEGMPNWSTVYRWQAQNPAFATRFAIAREMGEDALAHECLEIADDKSKDMVEDPTTGVPRLNTEHVQRSKLRIDTRLKLLAKWNPKKYGDRQIIDMDVTQRYQGMADDELVASIKAEAAKAGIALTAEMLGQLAGLETKH
jgi:hypothetical protein